MTTLLDLRLPLFDCLYKPSILTEVTIISFIIINRDIQVGVGAMVINPVKDEILVVREARNNYRPWKIPGGLS